MDWNTILSRCVELHFKRDVDYECLFKEMRGDVSGSREGRYRLAWWPKIKVAEYHDQLVDHLNKYPHTQGPIQPNILSAGTLTTLDLLYEYRAQHKELIGIFLCATLWPKIWASNKYYDRENWPSLATVAKLGSTISDAVFKPNNRTLPWHHRNTQVLPVIPECRLQRPLANVIDVIDHCANEYISVIAEYQCVKIVFQ